MKKIVGSIIILLGVLFLLSNYNLISLENIWDYIWTSILIIIGVTGLINKKHFDFFYGAIILIGGLYLLESLNLISSDFVGLTIWPLLIIGFGITFFFSLEKHYEKGNGKTYFALFSGVEQKINDTEFTSIDVSAIFGGVEIDLSKAKFKNNKAYINAQAAFGGIDLRVPEDVKVTTNGFPILGGIDNKAYVPNDAKYELIINYNIVCGGIEIKN